MTPSKLWHDPLLQFIAIGAALFIATQWLSERRIQEQQTIVVDAARVRHLSEMYQLQMGAPPSARELEHLSETFIRDEILYREALKLGLDKDDEIVRGRLIQKMEFLISDLEAPPEPSDSELRAFHERHAHRFSTNGTTAVPFEEIRDQVRHVWLEDRLKAANARRLAELSGGYDIVRTAPQVQAR